MALSKILPAGQSQFAGARNLIINGAMQVAQRGTSASAANASYVSVDRYLTSITGGGAFTLSQETDTPSGQGFKNSLKATVDTADSSIAASDYYVIQYRIEGQNVAHLMLGTSDAVKVTLSFWVKSSLTGNHGASLENGAATRSYPFQYNISTANTWEKITKTFQLDTSGTWLTTDVTGLKLMLDLGSGTSFQGPADAWAGANYHTASSSVQLIATGSATWYITGIQLEVGEQATPFEHRSYGDELARCQRYFELLGHAVSSGGDGYSFMSVSLNGNAANQWLDVGFKVEKRAAPSSIDSFNSYTVPSPTATGIGVNGFTLYKGSQMIFIKSGGSNGDAVASVSAEL